jgi:uncharacterized membrane protein
MNHIFKLFMLIIVLTVLDAIYLNSVSSQYQRIVKSIQGKKLVVKYIPTFIVYISIIVLLYYFIIRENRTPFEAFLLGSMTYAIFDFTNLAIFNKWDLKMSIIDSIWGGILFATSTFIFNKFIKKL